MPKQARIKRNRKDSPTQQDTFRYGVKVEPKARPVDYDTRVRPQAGSNNAEHFINMMDSLKDGLRATAGVMKLYNEESQKKGALSAAKGEELPKEANDHFIRGYEQFKGMGQGYVELQKILQDHYNENYTEDPHTFNRTQNQAIAQYFNGRSENFIQGAMDGAMQLQREFQGQFIKVKQEEFLIDKLTAARSYMDAQLAKLYKNPEVENKAAGVRAMLSDMQEFGIEGLNLTRSQVSKQLVSLMSMKAVDTGDPSFLDFAYEKDASGVRLIDNPAFAKEITDARDAATTEGLRRVEAARKEKEKAEKKVIADITSDMSELLTVVGAGDAAQRQEASKKILSMLRTYGDASRNKMGIELSAEQIEHYYKEVRILSGGDGNFAAQTNLDVFNSAYTMAKLNPGQLDEKVMDALKTQLSRSDYEEIIKTKAQTFNARSTRGYQKSQNERRWETNMGNTLDELGKKDPIWGSLYDNGDQRETLGQMKLFAEWDAFVAQNQREPNLDEQWAIMQDVKKFVDEQVPAVPRKDLPPEGKKRAMQFINPSGSRTATVEDDNIKSAFENLKVKNTEESPKETLESQGN